MVESVVQSHAEIVVGSAERPKIRVLHVDDELGLLKVAKQCLELQGPFHVDTACSVEEALSKLKEKEYDAVVSDYKMPGKDGLEFLEMLRKNGSTIPFVMFTGKGREEVAVKAWSLGADHYVNKTGDPETVYCDLAHNIRQAVEKKTALEMRNICQQRFLCLVENAAEGVGIFDPQGRFTYVNDALANLLGYPPRELAGRHFSDFLHKEDKPRILESFRQFSELEIEPPTLEFRAVRKDGRLAYLTAKPTKSEINGKIVGSQAIIVDITERKKMEQDLVDNQERLQRIFSASPDAIILSDMNGNIVACIQATLDILELSSKEELIGKSGFEFTPEKDHQRVRENLGRALEQGSVKNVEYAFLAKSGREIPTELSSSVLKDSSGKIVGFVSVAKDITERKKAIERTGNFVEEWKRTFDAISDFVFVLDTDFRLVRVNKALCDALKKEPRELVGKRCYEVLHGIAEPWPNCPHKKTLSTGQAATEEVNDSHLGCSLLVTDSPIRDCNGKLVGAVHIAKDITERKKAEEELRDSEERLSALFELAPDAYYLSDLKGNFVDGNKAAEKLVGYAKSELIGKSFLKLIPHQALRAAKLLAMNALGKPTGPDEFVLSRKDGTQVPVEVRTYPTRIKGKVLVLGIARDISARKKDEQAIRESQQKFEGLFRHNPEAAVYLDSDFKILDVNSRFCHLFDHSVEELDGKNINDMVVPEDLREEAERLDKDVKNSCVSHNTVRKRKDGSLVHVSVSACPVTFEGRLSGYVAIYKDITKLKDAEEHLKEMNKSLEVTNEKLHVVGSLTRHDVRNKLVVVTGNAYLLRKRLTNDPDAIECLGSVETAVREAVRIFDFAAAYERLAVEELAYVDVKKTVHKAVGLFPDLKGVKITNDCGGLTLLADSLLRQLFYNLIDDSLKYGEKLTQIRIRYEKSEDQLKLVYEDDGVGISKDAKPKLFSEGFTSGKGSGYGLYLIKRMMEVYGWTISETGTHGKGAQFTINIPKAKPDGRHSYKLDSGYVAPAPHQPL